MSAHDQQEAVSPTVPDGSRRRALIVGAGLTGRDLARRLAPAWQVTLLERDEAKRGTLAALFGDAVRVEFGDGTSELVLRRVGAETVDVLVIALRDDEACRLAARLARGPFGVRHVLAVAGDDADAETYRALGVESIHRGHAVAAALEARLTPGRVTAVNIGLGRGELLEVTLLPTSPLVGRPLASARGLGWRIGALYRGEELIVPAGETLPQAGDRIILVAPPYQMAALAEFVSSGAAEFPLRYGTTLGVLADPTLDDAADRRFWEEIFALLRSTPCRRLALFSTTREPNLDAKIKTVRALGAHAQLVETTLPLAEGLRQSRLQEIGLFMLPAPRDNALGVRLGLTRSPFQAFLDEVEVPVLAARNGGGWRRVLIGAGGAPGSAECGIDFARTASLPIHAIHVTPPVFIGGGTARIAREEALDGLAVLSNLLNVRIETATTEGNPIREILKAHEERDLLVVGRSPRRNASIFRPDVAVRLATLARSSVLVFPTRLDS